MVDFRPLLFLNALALMLLVSAGFASVRKDLTVPVVAASEPIQALMEAIQEPAPEPLPEPEPEPDQTSEAPAPETTPLIAEPFTIQPLPDEPEILARAEPVAALATRPDTPAVAPAVRSEERRVGKV